MLIGSNMSVTSKQEKKKDSDKCIIKMETNIKANLEVITHGVKDVYSLKMEMWKMVYGREENSKGKTDGDKKPIYFR